MNESIRRPAARWTRRIAVLGMTVLVLSGATACTPSGEAVDSRGASDPNAALATLLGLDPDAGADQLRAGEDAVADALARAVEGGDAVSTAIAARAGARVSRPPTGIATASFVHATSERSSDSPVPGVHTPVIVIDEDATATATIRDAEVTTRHDVTLQVVDQSAQYRSAVTRTARTGDRTTLTDNRLTTVDVPACVEDAAKGWEAKVSHTRTVESHEGEDIVTLETRMSTTATRGADDRGAIGMRDLRVDVTRTVTRPDGSKTTDQGTLIGAAPRITLDSDPDATTTAGIRVVNATAWFVSESGNVFLSALVAHVPEIVAAMTVATDAQDDSGLCILLRADTGGVRTLAPGGRASVTVTTVDPRTGKAIEGLPVTAYGLEGSASPESLTSTGSTVFTAGGGAAPYTLELTTSTPRGGDTLSVVFSGGWAFEGVTFTVSVDDVSASQTWSGFVCGDPLTDPWTFTQIAEGAGTIEFESVPFALDVRPGEWGQVPMIEPLSGVAEGEPPFRLFIDDVEPPEVTPTHQRVEADVQPAGTGVCG